MALDNTRLAAALKTIRGARGLTQQQVANASGMATNTVAILERGERGFTLKALTALARALRVPAEYFTLLGSSRQVRDPAARKLLQALEEAALASLLVGTANRSRAKVVDRGARRPAVEPSARKRLRH